MPCGRFDRCDRALPGILAAGLGGYMINEAGSRIEHLSRGRQINREHTVCHLDAAESLLQINVAHASVSRRNDAQDFEVSDIGAGQSELLFVLFYISQGLRCAVILGLNGHGAESQAGDDRRAQDTW